MFKKKKICWGSVLQQEPLHIICLIGIQAIFLLL